MYFTVQQKVQFIFNDIAYKAFSVGNRCSGVGVSTAFNRQGMWTTAKFRSFLTRYDKWSLVWEGVLHIMTFDLDLYLQGHLALAFKIVSAL